MIHPCDRQTDGRAIAYTRYSIYAVARKKPCERCEALAQAVYRPFAVYLNVVISGLSCNFRALVIVITNGLSVLTAYFITCSYFALFCYCVLLELKR